jgi:YD repeat-containing protein
VVTPLGESVFRFITPADLPHRQKDVEYAVTSWKDLAGAFHTVTDQAPLPTDKTQIAGVYTNSARVTEIMDVGSWWGKTLWNEDRDKSGKPLTRLEHDYTQLDGYLRLFQTDPNTQTGHLTGYDPDVEKAWGAPRAVDMSYVWAKLDGTSRNWPMLVKNTQANRDLMGRGFSANAADVAGGYLNAAVNVSVMSVTANSRKRVYFNRKAAQDWENTKTGEITDPIATDDPATTGATGWHSSVSGVRELRLPPIESETRTYGEGQKLLGVGRPTKWDARTGTVMEMVKRGRRTGTASASDPWAGHEQLVNRTWPAYWVYPDMANGPDPGADWTSLTPTQRNGIKNMVSQVTQTTSSRVGLDGKETYLNGLVDTWWQPDAGAGRWMKGGEFVWNGLSYTDPNNASNSIKAPKPFAGFPSSTNATGWAPLGLASANGLIPFKADNWLLVGATTKYDAYAHPIESVDGDGVYGCSKYGYPYDDTGLWNQPSFKLPAGAIPIAKFTNAQDAETLYWNFEGPCSATNATGMLAGNNHVVDTDPIHPDPIQRLNYAYTGEWAHTDTLPVTTPGPSGSPVTQYEVRYFVKTMSDALARASYPSVNAAEILQVVRAEKTPDGQQWWLVRAKVAPLTARTLKGLIDDVCVFPWRRNGAPASVSHYAYDRTLGLVTSITGSNGRTLRYQYDRLGRLKKAYDVYGKPTSSTRYGYALQAP